MDFLELVKQARTCRRFDESARLPEGCLEWLADCARLTPSGRNQQVLRYAAAESPEACAALFPALRWAGALKDWDGPAEGERPTGYLVLCAPKDAGPMARIDLGISAQTINLAANSRGLAACMFLSFDPDIAAKVIDLPDELSIMMVMAIGVPVETRRIAAVPANGCLSYWRDENMVHYVPKLTRADVLFCKK